jgi:hypothetical protein
MKLVVLTGAAGTGNATIARAAEAHQPRIADVLYFDNAGCEILDTRRVPLAECVGLVATALG